MFLCILTYLPSPPHAPFGVTTTSLQASEIVLYTISFRGFPSWASISEKKSSDWKSAEEVNHEPSFTALFKDTMNLTNDYQFKKR